MYSSVYLTQNEWRKFCHGHGEKSQFSETTNNTKSNVSNGWPKVAM